MGVKLTLEQFIAKANLVHNNEYEYLKSKYDGAFVKIIITCKKHGDFQQTPGNHLFGQKCPKCSKISAGQKLSLTNYDVDKYFIDNDIKIKRIDEYKNIEIPLKFQCLNCSHLWATNFNAIKSGGTGCPKCNDTKLINQNVDEYLLINNIKIKRIDEYKNNYTKIKWQCLECNHIWSAQTCEIMRKETLIDGKQRQGSGCPECARGRNEKIVGKFLADNGFINNKISIKLPINKTCSFPDFYIVSLNLIIEYNGIQHYQPIQFDSQTKESAENSFKYQQTRDQQLRNYCAENNIDLLEIDGRKYKGNRLIEFLTSYFK